MLSLNKAMPIPQAVIALVVVFPRNYNYTMFTQASTEALLALHLFQISPSRKKSRELLNQELVQVAMFKHGNSMSPNEINTAVQEILGQAAEFSHDENEKALHKSCAKGWILRKGKSTYILAEKTKKILSENIEKFEQSEREFDRGLAESIGRSLNKVLDPFAAFILCSSVKEIIQGIFYEHALGLRRLLDKQDDFSMLLEVSSDTESKLKQQLETFLSLQPNATIEEVMSGVQYFLGNLNKAQKHYVASLHYRVFYFQILNLDPRLQKLEAEFFNRTKLYLDTNILMSYLCDGHVAHQAVFDILNMSKVLGAKLFISSKTLQESERLVDGAKGFSRFLDQPKLMPILQMDPTAIDNPIIETFVVKRKENPRLNWAAFLSPFNQLEMHLITQDIEVSDDKCGDITADEAYSHVHTIMTDIKGIDIPLSIIEHDTYNLVLVQQLRNIYPATPLGSSVWLITIDTKLPIVDRRLIRQKKYPSPHCRLVEQWGAVLLPFQTVGRCMATDEYISWLVSQQLGAIFPKKVLDISFFKELESAEIELDAFLALDPEIAAGSLVDLQRDEEARALLAQIQSSPEEEKESTKSDFHQKVLNIIAKREQEYAEQDKKEIARLQAGIDELSRSLREMRLSKTEDMEGMKLLGQKLKEVKAELKQYESMPFWQRVKYVLKGKRK